MPRYGPPDAFETPRFSGPRTFMRLPHVTDLAEVDVAVVGIPTDGAQVFRSGSRFGPEAIRSASVMLRNYNPILDVDVCERLSLVDYGDVATVPGSTAESVERSAAELAEIACAGVVTLGLVATTPFSSRSCARSPPSTAHWHSCSSTPTTTCGMSTSGRSSFTEAWSAAPLRKA
jgi:agmatinase